jgi:hypothetical protein
MSSTYGAMSGLILEDRRIYYFYSHLESSCNPVRLLTNAAMVSQWIPGAIRRTAVTGSVYTDFGRLVHSGPDEDYVPRHVGRLSG